MTVSGTGALWQNGDDLFVGAEGNGMLTIADNGKVSSTSTWIGGDATHVGGEGIINIGAAPGDPGGPVGAGVLSTPTLQFGAGTGTLNFNHTGTDYVFSTALKSVGAGTHALNHYAGTTLLTGDSSGFAGTTTVSGGTLLVGNASGGKLGGAINVGSGAALGGQGVIGIARLGCYYQCRRQPHAGRRHTGRPANRRRRLCQPRHPDYRRRALGRQPGRGGGLSRYHQCVAGPCVVAQ